MAAGGDEAKRAFDAMMGMKKIDVAAIEAARLTFLFGPSSILRILSRVQSSPGRGSTPAKLETDLYALVA
jgi:hypothetical protein